MPQPNTLQFIDLCTNCCIGPSLAMMLLPGMAFAQTYINTEWVQTTGQPDDIHWSASTMDPFGDVLIVANTQLAPGISNVLLTKYNSSGDELWQRTFAGTEALNDHGIAVKTDQSGAVFVAATVNNTGNDLDFALLKYDVDGNLLWDVTWNGPNDLADVPVGLVLDTAGNIYMYGATWTDPLFSDFAVVKVDPSGNLLWSSTFDGNGYADAAVALMFDPDGHPMVLGFTASDPTWWGIAALRYHATTGAGLDTLYSPTILGGFKPKAVAVDEAGDILVTGSHSDGSSARILTLKIGAGVTMVWMERFEEFAFNGEGTAITTDQEGNVLVCGWVANSQGGREFITIKYDPMGDLLWYQVHKAHDSGIRAQATTIIRMDPVILVSGSAHMDSVLNFTTVGYGPDGSVLFSMDHGTPMSNDMVLTMLAGYNGVIYISGVSTTSTGSSYTTIKYDFYHKDNPAVLDSLGNPLYMANEVIVKFRPHLVDTNVVDNKGWQHGTLRRILPDSVLEAITDKFGVSPGYFDRMKVVKVFRQLTRADSISISRLGEEVRMPKLWSTFIISDASIGENVQMIADSLSSMWEYVAYAHSNLLFQLYSNDPIYEQGWQSSLKPTTEFPFADINIEPAWAIQVGQPFIKVGIVDSPVNWDHEDFLLDGQTKIGTGIDIRSGEELIQPAPNTYSSTYSSTGWHGSACAGIIGAIRNNGKGVAGIAGGDGSDNGSTGTAIVPLVVGTYYTNYLEVAEAAPAVLYGSSDIPTTGYGFACDILNMSWGGKHPSPFQPYPYAMVEAILSANRNQCVLAVAHGNYGGPVAPYRSIPSAFASFPDSPSGIVGDNVILSVGAIGDDGEYLYYLSNNTDGQDINSAYANGVDLVAPGSSSNIYTVRGGLEPNMVSCLDLDPEIFGFTETTRYTCFQATSAAAPHVAGVAALMLAEHSTINGAPNGLAPEDVEHILERSAIDIFNLDIDTLPYSGFLVGYDDYHGHGRLNAGAALTLVSDPYCVIHSGAPNSTSSQQFASETITVPTINLLEIPGGFYTAYRVQVTHNYTDVFPIDAEIVEPNGSWGRESSTIGTHAEENIINGRTWADYNFDISGNSATVTATTNTWFIQSGTENNVMVNAWYPAPPGELRTAYSHLVFNADCWGPSSVSIREEIDHQGIVLYPNPAQDVLTLECAGLLGTGWGLSVIDPMGRIILAQNLSVNAATQIPVAQLPSGTYCVLIRRGQEVHVRRFIKLH